MDFVSQLYNALENHGLSIDGEIDFSKSGFQRFKPKNSNKSDKPIFISLHDKGVIFGDWRDSSTWKTMWENGSKLKNKNFRAAQKSKKNDVQTYNAEIINSILKTSHDTKPDHPYVEKKRIIPYYGKQMGEKIVLPIIKYTGKPHNSGNFENRIFFKDIQQVTRISKSEIATDLEITGNNIHKKTYNKPQLKIISLQFINADGEKRFLKNHSYKDGFVLLNDDLDNPKKIFICEGWATGCSIKEVTGETVLCALSANNLVPVAKVLHRTFPNCEIIIAADHDEIGLEKAYEAAKLTNSKIFYPKHYKTDFNDLYVTHGFDALEKALGCHLQEEVCKTNL